MQQPGRSFLSVFQSFGWAPPAEAAQRALRSAQRKEPTVVRMAQIPPHHNQSHISLRVNKYSRSPFCLYEKLHSVQSWTHTQNRWPHWSRCPVSWPVSLRHSESLAHLTLVPDTRQEPPCSSSSVNGVSLAGLRNVPNAQVFLSTDVQPSR